MKNNSFFSQVFQHNVDVLSLLRASRDQWFVRRSLWHVLYNTIFVNKWSLHFLINITHYPRWLSSISACVCCYYRRLDAWRTKIVMTFRTSWHSGHLHTTCYPREQTLKSQIREMYVYGKCCEEQIPNEVPLTLECNGFSQVAVCEAMTI